jgi:hypothetical protein
MKKIPLAPEGWAYILPLMILTALSLLMQWYAAAIILGAFTLFLLKIRDKVKVGQTVIARMPKREEPK